MPNLSYKIVRNRRLTGSVSIKIKNGEVVVSAPFWVPKPFIDNFVQEKKDWIVKALQKTTQPVVEKEYFNGEDHLLFGTPHNLLILPQSKPTRTTVIKNGTNLEIKLFVGFDSQKQKQEIKDALLRFYLEQGIGYLTEKVNYYTNLLGVEYSKIEIKKVSSIWGSCSAGNALSFNRKLVMAPYEIIDYVIIHEVCHLRERNHSSRFWGLVFKYDRQYKEHRHWLHKNSSLLTL